MVGSSKKMMTCSGWTKDGVRCHSYLYGGVVVGLQGLRDLAEQHTEEHARADEDDHRHGELRQDQVHWKQKYKCE